jgi:glycosyltransferase involved in cell wall biosynthesis
MASGLPVVGTTVGGAGEILKDGQNGLAFPPGDPEALATQVSRLIGSPQLRQELAEAGRKTALEKFDIQRMVSELEKYMQSLIVNSSLDKI